MALSFITPPRGKNTYGGLVEAGTLSDLPTVGAAPRHIAKGRFWLVHETEGLTALHSSCTHLECLFTWDEQQQVFICPCHGSEFARDGSVLKGPAKRALDRFPLNLIDDQGDVIRATQSDTAQAVPVTDLLAPQQDAPQDERDPKTPRAIFVQVDTGHKVTIVPRFHS